MSIYNEYRPQNLAEVRGQQEAVKIVKGFIRTQNIPHAFLFNGIRGTGKTTIAKILARTLDCEHPTENGPCNCCESCRQALQGSNLDIIEMDAASNNKTEDVHNILDSSRYTPIYRKKVYILDEVHALTSTAWQALLKTLEEPPKNVYFILCTTELHKVPATILSRCSRIEFKKIDDDIILQALMDVCEEKEVSYEKDALKLLVKEANGGMRDGYSLLENYLDAPITVERVITSLGIGTEEAMFDIVEGIATGNSVKAVSGLHSQIKKGVHMGTFVKALIGILTDMVYWQQSQSRDYIINSVEYVDHIISLASHMTSEKCLSLIKRLGSCFTNNRNISIEYSVEVAILTEIATAKTETTHEKIIANLLERVERLEKGILPSNNVSNGATSCTVHQGAVVVNTSMSSANAVLHEEEPASTSATLNADNGFSAASVNEQDIFGTVGEKDDVESNISLASVGLSVPIPVASTLPTNANSLNVDISPLPMAETEETNLDDFEELEGIEDASPIPLAMPIVPVSPLPTASAPVMQAAPLPETVAGNNVSGSMNLFGGEKPAEQNTAATAPQAAPIPLAKPIVPVSPLPTANAPVMQAAPLPETVAGNNVSGSMNLFGGEKTEFTKTEVPFDFNTPDESLEPIQPASIPKPVSLDDGFGEDDDEFYDVMDSVNSIFSFARQ